MEEEDEESYEEAAEEETRRRKIMRSDEKEAGGHRLAPLSHNDHDLFQSSDWDLGHIYRYKVNIAILPCCLSCVAVCCVLW